VILSARLGTSLTAKRFDELSGRDHRDALSETNGKVPEVSGDEEIRMCRERDLEERRIFRIGKISWDECSDDELSDDFEALKEASDF
jgi:hypothetical protein